MGTEQHFYGLLQALGIEKGQETLTRVEDMATLYLSAIANKLQGCLEEALSNGKLNSR
ncbi:MAG: hypothetical protein F6J86_38455 [Symploca sp. SIO1B1]|nr:hypothetical protein [Symploca sp. SIO1B1]